MEVKLYNGFWFSLKIHAFLKEKYNNDLQQLVLDNMINELKEYKNMFFVLYNNSNFEKQFENLLLSNLENIENFDFENYISYLSMNILVDIYENKKNYYEKIYRYDEFVDNKQELLRKFENLKRQERRYYENNRIKY